MYLLFVVMFCTGIQGCDRKAKNIERDVVMVSRMLGRIGNELSATMSWQNTREMGGNLTTYVTSELPQNHPGLNLKPKPEPYCIVMRPGEDGGFSVEGYGKDATAPIITRTGQFGTKTMEELIKDGHNPMGRFGIGLGKGKN